jgi:hypothetical protein
VISVLADEIVVAPFAHRNGGGSVAVKPEDVQALAATPPGGSPQVPCSCARTDECVAPTETLAVE